MPGDPCPLSSRDDPMSDPVPAVIRVDSEPTALPDERGAQLVEPNDLMPGETRCPLSSQTIQCLTRVPAVMPVDSEPTVMPGDSVPVAPPGGPGARRSAWGPETCRFA
ncbi:unnamed protein product [Staurois parvus]|uniref:Uncharacterized protein n=1 Tax=Staurois parvus TaxID=386267 RepID=A0ABN9EGY2_9NEOB|nr:unnamed protein product [Staurois parvus]